ncbi:P-loop containing nucleoside triphosphate hydrolase protein [Bisporella sp. PMI_857]|nr:P-loop containing nucleoside triphosphate hydrolase protein [Bisporella sp. PMI_857]
MLSYENRATMGQQISATDHLPISTAPSDKMSNGVPSSASQQPTTEHQHIWLITGPAGCGKSTVAKFVATSMNLPFLEGDDFHSAANVEKMSKGIPLNDEDRWDWLASLREASVKSLSAGHHGVVLTCSALKKKYRDVIRVAAYYDHDVMVHFVYLHAREEVLVKRVAERKGHYMGAAMVHSQFLALEEPGEQEKDVITVDVSGSIEEVERDALAKVEAAVQATLVQDS